MSSGSDLASFSSLQKWDAEVNGFRIPEAEFRQTWDADSSLADPESRASFQARSCLRGSYVCLSNERETLRKMRTFLVGLK